MEQEHKKLCSAKCCIGDLTGILKDLLTHIIWKSEASLIFNAFPETSGLHIKYGFHFMSDCLG